MAQLATKPIDPEPEVPGYTPGPWAVFHDHPDEETAKNLAYIRPVKFPDTFFCLEIASLFCCELEPAQNANARLMAAAPELVEALQYAVEQLEAYKTTQVGIHHAAIEKGRAAIAKAIAPANSAVA